MCAVQHLLVVAAGATLLGLGLACGLNRRLALAGSLVAVSSLATLSMSQAVMSDLFGGVVDAVAPGCSVGLAELSLVGSGLRRRSACRGGPGSDQASPRTCLCLGFLVVGRAAPIKLRSTGICIAVAVLLTVAGFVVRNGAVSGHYSLSPGVWKHLYNHVVPAHRPFNLGGSATQTVVTANGQDPRDMPHWEFVDRLEGAGWKNEFCQAAVKAVAQEAYASAQWAEHVRFTLSLAWRNLSKDPGPTSAWFPGGRLRADSNDDTPLGLGPHETGLGWRVTMSNWQAAAWYWLVVAGLVGGAIGCLIARQRRLMLALLAISLAYICASSAVEHELPRNGLLAALFWPVLAVWLLEVPLQAVN